MKYQIYEYDYQPYQEAAGEEYNTIEEAAAVLLADITTDDWPYMIGTDEGIEAFVFQGRVYRESSRAGKVMPPPVMIVDGE